MLEDVITTEHILSEESYLKWHFT